MNYVVEITIDAPRDKVVRLFQDPEGIKEWQPTFIGLETLEGEAGEEGSVHLLKYQNKKGKMEIRETIVENKLPDYFVSTYNASGVHNVVKSIFIDNGDGSTTYRSENEFQFNSFLMKIFAFIMPGAFKKQTNHYLRLFKEYVERAD